MTFTRRLLCDAILEVLQVGLDVGPSTFRVILVLSNTRLNSLCLFSTSTFIVSSNTRFSSLCLFRTPCLGRSVKIILQEIVNITQKLKLDDRSLWLTYLRKLGCEANGALQTMRLLETIRFELQIVESAFFSIAACVRWCTLVRELPSSLTAVKNVYSSCTLPHEQPSSLNNLVFLVACLFGNCRSAFKMPADAYGR